MNTDGSEPVEKDQTDHSIGDSMPWGDKRAEDIPSNVGPVKGHGQQRESGYPSKQLVNHDVVRLDPCDPCKHREALCYPAWEPVPHERTNKDVEEISITGDLPPIRYHGIGGRVIVEGIEERSIDQIERPDHSSLAFVS